MTEYQDGYREGVMLAGEDVDPLYDADRITEGLISEVKTRFEAGLGERADDSEFHRGLHAGYGNMRERILPVLSEGLELVELLKRLNAILSDGAEIRPGEGDDG